MSVELIDRLAVVEDKVDAVTERLDGLILRVDAIDQRLAEFREETSGEFAGVRQEMEGGFAAVRREMVEGFAAVRPELRAEIRDGDKETRRHMLMLHEDLIARIRTIGEGIDDLRGR